MGLTTAGRDVIANAIIGGTYTAYNNTNARIGVGDGTTGFVNTQTDLQGTNKLRKGMDATYPTISAPALTFRSTFAAAEANFTWNEIGVFNAATGGMLDRFVPTSLGTKPSTEQWQITVTLTVVAS